MVDLVRVVNLVHLVGLAYFVHIPPEADQPRAEVGLAHLITWFVSTKWLSSYLVDRRSFIVPANLTLVNTDWGGVSSLGLLGLFGLSG